MNRDVKQLLVVFVLVCLEIGFLWAGTLLVSPDMNQRNDCYAEGVAGLPQGVDQTLLQTQSKAYKECLARK
ncbi:MAG TPA: hypothetical protein VLF20_05880 [Patescibacteria group bacterium]|nr:hypothetical protein [Patescibacteria group bacterium]